MATKKRPATGPRAATKARRKTGKAKSTAQRPYSSPLREEQAVQTRDRILTTAAEMLLELEPVELAIADVAAAAGVSPRTVYRHFASVPELLRGIAERMQRGDFDGPPPTLEQVLAHLVETCRRLDDDWRWARVEVRTPSLDVAGGKAMFRHVSAPYAGRLDEEGKQALAAMLAVLFSPANIEVTTGMFGVKPSRVARILLPLVDSLLDLADKRPELFNALPDDAPPTSGD